MKQKLYTIGLLILFYILPSVLFAQSNSFVIGANGSMFTPIGSLTNRFLSTYGGSVYFGQNVSQNWIWTAKLEYLNFNKENSDKLFITRKITVQDKEQTFKLPLPKLTMDLKIYGLSAQAQYNLFNYSFLSTDLSFGFGIYRWESSRSSYYDTLRADTSGGLIDIAILKVPEIKQQNWSGGLSLGLDVDVKIIDPIWINFGAHYKAIIGELWATLSLDLENISTFQMFDVHIGLKARL
ncbi:MAG: hypothetical protein KJ666_14290 [Bacteroidetes bacterium]|nr:hypothetical protein [Bacteroidota bacterium]MBU2586154.1 hypothetical protein [Bacteroidota bacterium]